MAREVLNDGATGGVIRGNINSNFEEIFGVASELKYPDSNLTRRGFKCYFEPALMNGNIGNGSGPLAGRWYIGGTVGSTRPVVAGSNGRPVINSATNSNQTFFLTGQSGQHSGLLNDVGATTRWLGRFILRPSAQPLPTAAEDYIFSFGLGSGTATATPSGNFAIFALYLTGGNAVFEARSRRSSGTVQVTSLTLPGPSVAQTLEVLMTSADVKFFIDGVLVATHTTVPTGLLNDGISFQGLAGSSIRAIQTLFVYLEVDFGVSI